MSGIFGEGNPCYGSLGMGAPDTGRGDAFDQQAAHRGYGISPSAGAEIEIGTPRAQRIPPGAVIGGIEFGTPRAKPIVPGSYLPLGAVTKRSAAVSHRIQQLRLERMRATMRINAIDAELRRLGS